MRVGAKLPNSGALPVELGFRVLARPLELALQLGVVLAQRLCQAPRLISQRLEL